MWPKLMNILISSDLEKVGFHLAIYYIYRYCILDTYIDTCVVSVTKLIQLEY